MRAPSGVPGFDALVQGGFPGGAAVVVQGPAGREKDAFLVQFIAEGLRAGGAALVVLSSVSPAAYRDELKGFGVDVDRAIAENRLKFVDWHTYKEAPVHDVEMEGPTFRSSIDLANVGIAVSRAIASLPRGVEARAAIELLSPALSVYELATVYSFAQSTKAKLERFGFTSLFVLEKAMHDERTLSSLHQPFDGVVDIERSREGDEIVRKVGVLTLKATAAQSNYAPLEIGPDNRLRVTTGASDSERGRTFGKPEGAVRSGPTPDSTKREDPARRLLAAVEQRLALNPRDADALFVKAAAQAKFGDIADGVATLETLATVDDAYPGLWILKAKLHARRGEREKAQESRRRAQQVESRAERPTRERGTPLPPTPKPTPTYECPSCKALVGDDDATCPTCGAVFETASAVGAEDREAPKPPTPPPRARKGLTNGLVRETPRGAGRTNGLVNGVRGRTNGLVNGTRGRTNGLVNGVGSLRSGLTNGLTNGSGFTNGLGSERLRRETKIARWKLYVIPLLSAALLLVPMLAPSVPLSSAYPLVIDGDASDWSPQAIAVQGAGIGANPNVEILRFGVADNVDYLAFFIEVNGSALRGGDAPPTTDTFRVFLDTDRNASTGYRVDGLGADRMLELSGWGGAVNASRVYEWDANREAHDSRGWIKPTPVSAAAKAGRLETQVDWLALLPAKAPVFATLHARGFDGSTDVADYALASAGGSLLVLQEPVPMERLTVPNEPLLRLDLKAHGGAVRLGGLTVTLTGSAPFNAVSALRLVDGDGVLVDQRIPVDRRVPFQFSERAVATGASSRLLVLAEATPMDGLTVGALVVSPADVSAADGAVTVRRLPSARDVGYIGSPAPDARIDGGFAEWTNIVSDASGDTDGRPNPDVDLTAFAAQASGNASYFYTRVAGRMMAGTWVPEANGLAVAASPSAADQDRDTVPDAVDPLPFDFNNDGTPDAQTAGDYDGDGVRDYGQPGGTDLWLNTTIPVTFPAPYAGRTVSVYIGFVERPYRSPDDILRVFVDLDNSSWSGYAVGGLGADRMIEVSGLDGRVRASGFFTFAGNYPGDWSWQRLADASFALGFDRVEFAAPENVTAAGSRMYIEIGDAFGTRDAMGGITRSTRSVDDPSLVESFDNPPSSFQVAPSPVAPPTPWASNAPGTRASTLIDGNSGAISTQYNHQRKVVRAGDVPVDTACNATNSDGCWYAVFYDQTPAIESDSKDGASVAVPTTLGLLDSLTTTLSAGDNLIVAIVQLDNTGAAARLITAGNLQLRRGTLTSDPLVSQTQFEVRIAANGATGDGMFVVLLGKDGAAPASPTYGFFGAADVTGVNAEVKILVLNGFASGDSVFTDGASVALQTSTTSLASVSTTFPASSASLPNIVIAAVQTDSVSGVLTTPTGKPTVIRRGTLSTSTVIATSQFEYNTPNNAAPDGAYQILVALDTAGGANQAYSVWTANDDCGNCVNGEAKILAFRGLAANWVDTGSVAIGTTRTVIGTATTTFAVGDDVVLGAIQLDAVGATRTIAAAADDIRRTGEAGGSSNEFAHVVAVTGNAAGGAYQGFVRKVTTTAANPSYEGAATSPSAGNLNAELKLVAIHIKNSGATGDDRVVMMRSSDTSGSTWGSQIILASGNAADSPLLYTFDSSEPSIAIDSGGFLHVVWVSASASGDQSTFDRVRYTKTTVVWPTQSELATAGNWEAVTNVDDASLGFMPTVSTDASNNPHVAWSGSKTSGTVYYKNKAAGTWRATVSWGTTYTGLSVDVSPQVNYVALARYFEAATNEIQHTVCKDLNTSNCDAATEFTKFDGTAGFDTVATAVETASYPSLATTYDANGDLWVAYADGQYALPESDISTGGWTTTPLWQRLDEFSADDSTTEIQKAFYGLVAYGEGTVTAPRYREYDGTNFLAEASAQTAAAVAWVVVKASPTDPSDEIMGILTSTNTLYIQTWDGSTWTSSWNTSLGGSTTRRFDIAFEGSSGDAVAVFGDGTTQLKYRKRVGGTWDSSNQNAGGVLADQPLWVRAESRPTNDDIFVAVVTNALTLHAMRWAGSTNAWGDQTQMGTNVADANKEGADIAFERTSGDAFVLWGTASNTLRYREFTSAWQTEADAYTLPDKPLWVTAAYDPISTSSKIAVGMVLNNGNFEWGAWNGTAWVSRPTAVAAREKTVREMDVAFEKNNAEAVFIFNTLANPAQMSWRTWTSSGGFSVVTAETGTSGNINFMQLVADPNSNAMLALYSDANSALFHRKWDGSSWSSLSSALETNLPATATQEPFMFAWSDGSLTFEVKFSSVVDPQTSSGHFVKYRMKKSGTGTANVNAYLYQGTTLISSDTQRTLGTTYTTYTWTLSGGEADSITNYSDLRIRITTDSGGDSFVAYATWAEFEVPDVAGGARRIYARFLDFPSAGWAAAEVVDALVGTTFTRPSIGIDKDNNVHALYVATSGPQVYYNKRTAGAWGTRFAVEHATSDNPTIMVRAPNDATYGTATGGLYWKTSTSETYFHIPEFEVVAVPILGILLLCMWRRRQARRKQANPARFPSADDERSDAPSQVMQ